MKVIPALLLLSISSTGLAQMSLSADALLEGNSIGKNPLEAIHKAFVSNQSMEAFISGGLLIQGETVQVKVVPTSEDTASLLSVLTTFGMKDARVLGHAIYGNLPMASIPSVMQLTGIRSVNPEIRGTTNSSSLCSNPGARNGGIQIPADCGATGLAQTPAPALALAPNDAFSAGDQSLNSDRAREVFGATGANVTIGVISSSYDCLGTAGSNVQAGLLPTDVFVLQEADCDVVERVFPANIDEGRAMMQLIHQIAPEADLVFHTAGGIAGNFLPELVDAVDSLTEFGVDIIVDDIFTFGSPFFQDGFVSQAVDNATAAGVSYFTSSGNFGRDAWGDTFVDSGVLGFEEGRLHDFDPGAGVDVVNSIEVPVGVTINFFLEWDQPFFSVSGGNGTQNNVDIIVFDGNDNPIFFTDFSDNIGGDPRERFFISNDGELDFDNDGVPDTRFGFGIQITEGAAPGRLKLIGFSTDVFPSLNLEWPSASSPMNGHQLARGAFSVGAARYTETPRFGQSPAIIENFSSVGGAFRLFDRNGGRIMEQRRQPLAVGPNGVNTSFFGILGEGDLESDGLPNFFGTSAASPQVAAVAALMLSVNPELTPLEIRSILTSSSEDMDDPESAGLDLRYDFATGFGYVNALRALEVTVARQSPPVVPEAPRRPNIFNFVVR